MFSIHRNEIDWGGRKLVLETGRIARQADGAVLCTYGDTVVLCSVVGQRTPKPGINFFPLTVNYQEKSFAAGKIPGGFFKREGRPSEKEVLTSRLIDRPIRPLFHPNFRCETQVIATVLSHDLENDPDVVAMIGSSAALTISGIPFLGPIGAARVGYVDGKYVLNPRLEDSANSALDLIVAGTVEGVLMVESQAKELSEEVHAGRRDVRSRGDAAGHQRDHRSRRKVRQGAVGAAGDAAGDQRHRGQAARAVRSRSARGLSGDREAGASREDRGRQKEGRRSIGQRSGRGGEGRRPLPRSRKRYRARQYSQDRSPNRRPRRQDRPPDHGTGRRVAARARFGALHPRRDPGAGRGDAGHGRG